ncbi:hypothetical protein PF010_g8107 [Phytophthora fragariae]|uniref:RxLR effector protein n=2 Tax=Phytophthora fragariae TaxID=53985 RepID=A0A6G0LFG6_9STRA|nr:hypothetical protein PF010_g8107 [Phytophthora fragariae]
MRLGYILLLVVAFAILGFAVADNAFDHENAIPRDSRSLKSSSKAEAGVDTTNAETEERMKLTEIAKVASFSKKESSVIKNSAPFPGRLEASPSRTSGQNSTHSQRSRAGGRAPAVYITPEYAPVAPSGIHRRPTLWSMGRAMLSQAGAPDPQDTDNMGAYAAAAYACGGPYKNVDEFNWSGCRTQTLARCKFTRATATGKRSQQLVVGN